MLLQKLTLASAALLAGGLIAWGASAALVSLRRGAFEEVGREPESSCNERPKPAVPRPESDSLEAPGKITVRGRVLGPDGRPVPGAKIYRTPARSPTEPYSSPSPRRPDRTAASSSSPTGGLS